MLYLTITEPGCTYNLLRLMRLKTSKTDVN